MSRRLNALAGIDAVGAALGVILGAVYMLTLTQKTFFGPLSNPKNKRLPDLTVRETVALAPLVLFVFVIGLFPAIFIDRTKDSVLAFVEHYNEVWRAGRAGQGAGRLLDLRLRHTRELRHLGQLNPFQRLRQRFELRAPGRSHSVGDQPLVQHRAGNALQQVHLRAGGVAQHMARELAQRHSPRVGDDQLLLARQQRLLQHQIHHRHFGGEVRAEYQHHVGLRQRGDGARAGPQRRVAGALRAHPVVHVRGPHDLSHELLEGEAVLVRRHLRADPADRCRAVLLLDLRQALRH